MKLTLPLLLLSASFANGQIFTNTLFDFTLGSNNFVVSTFATGPTNGTVAAITLPQIGYGFGFSQVSGHFLFAPAVSNQYNLQHAVFHLNGYSDQNAFTDDRFHGNVFTLTATTNDTSLQLTLVRNSVAFTVYGQPRQGREYLIQWQVPDLRFTNPTPVVSMWVSFAPDFDDFEMYWMSSNQQTARGEPQGLYNAGAGAVLTTFIDPSFDVPMFKMRGSFISPRISLKRTSGGWELNWANYRQKYQARYSRDLVTWADMPFVTGVNRGEVRMSVPSSFEPERCFFKLD
jgi:hypothetical protein